MKSKSPRGRAKRRAFTLIELMVVVVIIAIIAAVAVPAMLGAMQDAPQSTAPAETIAQAPLTVEAIGGDSPRLAPRIEASTVQVDLQTGDVLDGLQVHSRYVARFSGRFVIRNVDPGADRIAIFFPFPSGMNEARSVSLQLISPDGRAYEPVGATYALGGMRWTGPVASGETLTALVTYTATGRDAFVYDLSAKTRSGKTRVRIKLADATRAFVPASSLQPSDASDDALSWNFDHLIAERPIVVELPAGSSPLGKLILLFQFAAVAVLMFGAGFWFLGEEASPGALDTFRWGHFLLLAMTYSLFFAMFGVLVYRFPLPIALAVSGLTSLPLLGFHVSRIISLRFSLTRALPLALYTLTSVVGAVYWEAHRPVVILAAAVAVIAYVTLRFRAFSGGRRAHMKAVEERAERQRLDASLKLARGQIDGELSQFDELSRRARRRCETCPPGFDLETARVEHDLTSAAEAASAAVTAKAPLPTGLAHAEHVSTARRWLIVLEDHRVTLAAKLAELSASDTTLCSSIGNSQSKLQAGLTELDQALDRALTTDEEAARALEEETPDEVESETAACQRAQTTLAAAVAAGVEIRQTAAGAGPRERGPRQLASRAARAQRRLDRASDRLRESTGHLSAQVVRIEERQRQRERHGRHEHCMACGALCDSSSGYCAECGQQRAHALSCGRCGESARFPAQVTKKRWREIQLHCESCGHGLPGG